MTSRAEGFLDRSGEGLGGGEGSTNFGRLTGFFKRFLRSSLPRALSEADLDLSRLPLVGAGFNHRDLNNNLEKTSDENVETCSHKTSSIGISHL